MKVVFMGSGEIGLPSLEWLRTRHDLVAVVAQPDKPAGRKQTLTPPPTKAFAREHGIPVLQPGRVRDPRAVAEIAAFEPEVIVVMAYGQILPEAVLSLPRLACLNLHASLLPKYRGAAPIQAAIEAGEGETGITVIWMDKGLDTGNILGMKPLAIRRRETGATLHDRLAELAPLALADAMEALAAGTAPSIVQDHENATYAPKLSRESGVIDWHASSAAIDRRVRAMNPWPAASTSLVDPVSGAPRRLKIFSLIRHTRDRGTEHPGAQPGEVLRADERGLLIATGEGGPVLLREIQLEGKRRMSARDFLHGHPVAPGTRLGGGPGAS